MLSIDQVRQSVIDIEYCVFNFLSMLHPFSGSLENVCDGRWCCRVVESKCERRLCGCSGNHLGRVGTYEGSRVGWVMLWSGARSKIDAEMYNELASFSFSRFTLLLLCFVWSSWVLGEQDGRVRFVSQTVVRLVDCFTELIFAIWWADWVHCVICLSTSDHLRCLQCAVMRSSGVWNVDCSLRVEQQVNCAWGFGSAC